MFLFCMSLWEKASVKCINVNANVLYYILIPYDMSVINITINITIKAVMYVLHMYHRISCSLCWKVIPALGGQSIFRDVIACLRR